MIYNSSGNRLNDLVAKIPCRILAHRSSNRLEIRTYVDGILSGGDGGINSGGASTPDGLLGGQLTGKIQRFFQTQSRHKTSYLQGSKINDEFFFFELRFQKIFPLIRNVIFRNKLPVVGNDRYGARYAQYVSFNWVYHAVRNSKNTVFRHPENIVFRQIRYVFFAKVDRYMGDVPSLSLSGPQLQDKPL